MILSITVKTCVSFPFYKFHLTCVIEQGSPNGFCVSYTYNRMYILYPRHTLCGTGVLNINIKTVSESQIALDLRTGTRVSYLNSNFICISTWDH